MKLDSIKTYIALVLAMVGWALSFVWFKVAVPAYGPLTIIFLRLIISTIIVFLFLKLTGKLVLPNKKELKMLFFLALFHPLLYYLGESFGLTYISSTMGAVIVATIPLFAVIPARVLYNERVNINFYLGAALSLFGVLLVVFEGDFSASFMGIALEFVAVFASVAYSVMLKKIPERLSAFNVVFYQNAIGAMYYLPLWLTFESKDTLNMSFNPEAFMAIVQLSVVASILAFVLFAYGVRKLGVSKANVFINAIPGLTAIFAWVILGEAMKWAKFAGIFLLILGLCLAQREKK